MRSWPRSSPTHNDSSSVRCANAVPVDRVDDLGRTGDQDLAGRIHLRSLGSATFDSSPKETPMLTTARWGIAGFLVVCTLTASAQEQAKRAQRRREVLNRRRQPDHPADASRQPERQRLTHAGFEGGGHGRQSRRVEESKGSKSRKGRRIAESQGSMTTGRASLPP